MSKRRRRLGDAHLRHTAPMSGIDHRADPVSLPTLREAAPVWARIGLLGFGGPAGQIALMHRMLVEERRWIGEARFLAALNYCMLLPGPEATQLAVYIGWLLQRTRGGLLAGALFVLPGIVALLLLSALYVRFGPLPAVAALFYGLKPAVLAVVVEALARIGRRALRRRLQWALAAAAFLALFVLHIGFPWVVLGAGLVGALWPQHVLLQTSSAPAADEHALVDRLIAQGALDHLAPAPVRQLRTALLGLVLWAAPVVALAAWLGPDSLIARQGLFFSQVAVVSFGGAYAVLAYVAQQAVERLHWLGAAQMLDGLALAETTPGPLVMVLQFVAFVAAWQQPQGLPPAAAALLAAGIAVWVTFVPCFLWIFLGAPYIERLQRQRRVRAALAAVTAAVVGVIANLSLWFALHVLFARHATWRAGPLALELPVWSSLDALALALMLASLAAMLRWRLGMGRTLAAAAAMGWLARMALG